MKHSLRLGKLKMFKVKLGSGDRVLVDRQD